MCVNGHSQIIMDTINSGVKVQSGTEMIKAQMLLQS